MLRRAGFDPGQKTFFVWEGVSMYIRDEGVAETLRTVAEAAPGSGLVMDFAGRRLIELMREIPEIPQNKYTTLWGDPWIFGLPDGREREFFRQCGLRLDRIMPFFGKAGRKYLTKADGTRLGPKRGRPPRGRMAAEAQPGVQASHARDHYSGDRRHRFGEIQVVRVGSCDRAQTGSVINFQEILL